MKSKKKKCVANSKNAITLVIVLAICLIIIVSGLCNVLNHYFDDKDNKQNEGIRPTFYADEMKEMDIVIPETSNDKELSSLDFKVSLQNKNEVTSVCKYNLYYYWDENPDGYYRTGSQEEITLTGKLNDRVIFDNLQLNDYNLGDLKTLLASYYIVNDGEMITNQSWQITSYFHGRDNQEAILNNTYPGKIGIEDVACSEAVYLKDQNITENNNYICLNSRDEFCPEDKLYQVISMTNGGIKVVRTKAFGISSWSNDLLPRLEEAFLNTDGKYLRGMILEHDYPIYDEENLDASLDTILVNEAKAENKVQSQIGILSLSDYKILNNLKEYDKPYLILSNSGLTLLSDGNFQKKNSTGYIYPVFYLDSSAVVSKGDGSWGNPYFVN